MKSILISIYEFRRCHNSHINPLLCWPVTPPCGEKKISFFNTRLEASELPWRKTAKWYMSGNFSYWSESCEAPVRTYLWIYVCPDTYIHRCPYYFTCRITLFPFRNIEEPFYPRSTHSAESAVTPGTKLSQQVKNQSKHFWRAFRLIEVI